MTRKQATIAVRSGLNDDEQYGCVVPPIHLSSTYNFTGFNEPRAHDYSRRGNPTRDVTQRALAELEGGAGAVLTNTGMSAIHLVTTVFLKPGDLLVAPHDCYGGSYRLFDSLAKRGCYRVLFVDQNDEQALKQALAEKPKLVLVESPSNPLLRVVDIAKICQLARDAGAISVVDNTFLSPALQNPLALGADLVLHSCTKYLNGHSDVVAGVVIAKDPDVVTELAWWANNIGVTAGAFDSYLLLRGIRTLSPRMDVAQRNAQAIVDFLKTQPLVKKLYHPSLPENQGHEIAARQQKGFGAMLSFELDGDEQTLGRQLHKFGGSSLADVKCYLRVAGIMTEYSQPGDMMVVSAAGSTTNQLISWLKLSQTDRLSAHQVQQSLRRYQSELIAGLLPADVADGLIGAFTHDLERLAALLDSGITDAVYAEVVGHGEVWSARLMAAVLQHLGVDAAWLDARDFLRAERAAQPQVDEGLSYPLLQQLLVQHPGKRIVVTGFISRSNAGETVLLGRNGSDYSATQIGALAGVSRVTIWSDVAGVYSADPRKVKDACLLPLLRLDEASELARLAAPVLHARTLQPVSGSDIDLQLRCSYTPDQGSTRIERVLASGTGARIVTSHDDICLIEFQVPAGQDFRLAHKEIDTILKRAQVRPLAVGVHNDRQLLQFCYTAEVADSALKILDEAGLPGELRLRQGLALVAMVGAGVTRNPLHCHRFWQEFTWQSEEGISLVAVLRKGPTESLIQGLHTSLFRAEKRIGLVLFGKGNIGSRWLELFAREQVTLSARTGFEFILAGVVDSRRSLLNYEGLDASRALAFFNDEAVEQDEESLFLWMRAHPYDDLVVLDVTASEQLADQYLDFASHGFHVISANKLAGASSTDKYRQIHDAFEKTGRHWLYNATVGAGLPVNHTVRDLIESGDSILALSGIFSGTLSWLFLQFDGTVPFTDLVDQAWQQGLTEPDPRVDLSGKDVMRKLVILAREAGYDIEPDSVRVESLVPAGCEEGSVDHFFENGEELNEQMVQRLEAANEMGLVLRYVARFEANGKARVGVEAVRPEHPLAALLPCDNVFAIESRWYRDNPLVIRGPGAGRDVTAGAIQSDINRLAKLL